jgi:hypothetical protein
MPLLIIMALTKGAAAIPIPTISTSMSIPLLQQSGACSPHKATINLRLKRQLLPLG